MFLTRMTLNRQRAVRWVGSGLLGASFFACGGESNQPSQPGTPSDGGAHTQSFAAMTQASSTTSAELGVVAWWTIADPNFGIAVLGVDASKDLRVEFDSTPTWSGLADATGTFKVVFNGDKVSSNTLFGNPHAMRTLDLINWDLAPPSAGAPPAVKPMSASPTGSLRPTDTQCPPSQGQLVGGGCPLVCTGANGDELLAQCKAQANAAYDQATDATSHACWYGTQQQCDAARAAVLNKEQWVKNNCNGCGAVWGLSADDIIERCTLSPAGFWSFVVGNKECAGSESIPTRQCIGLNLCAP
jgi:hypothetical protein